jgi:hypothetical protein
MQRARFNHTNAGGALVVETLTERTLELDDILEHRMASVIGSPRIVGNVYNAVFACSAVWFASLPRNQLKHVSSDVRTNHNCPSALHGSIRKCVPSHIPVECVHNVDDDMVVLAKGTWSPEAALNTSKRRLRRESHGVIEGSS